MEEVVFPRPQKHNLQSHRFSPCGPLRDMWVVVREGAVADVDAALASLKKNGGNINSRNVFGLTPLHIATWRNHLPIVRRLLLAGADPNARDGESGWSSLHRALHFGHLAVASVLLQSGASITLEDSKFRTPVDLLSGPVLQTVGNRDNSATEVFSWGSGVNYQLGTGNAHIQKLPCKLDSLNGLFIRSVSAAKFHSVAVTALGEVYTWGFGRGGRLGHPDFDIHSGQAAVITPRQVTSGLGARRVKVIAAAKHHTVVATEGGEVFTWGSNREGQLGYPSVDTQPTPRRVSSLKSKIVALAAANKHTAVVSDLGDVFTWGSNKEGQLGYGTSNSASNYTPRVVEYLKGKVLIGVAAAKYHTVVLGADGEVFTWGHKLVNPRRVIISRNIKRFANTPLKFHHKERLHLVSIAAGLVHSMAITEDGALFYWVSSDPDLQCQQLYSFYGRTIVSISAGKYWIAAVTATGDVYMWDGKKKLDEPPVATRLHGVKKATSVSVGETHLLIIKSLYHPVYPISIINNPQNLELKFRDEMDEDFVSGDLQSEGTLSTIQKNDVERRPIPSLKSLCEKVAAECLVEARSAVQLLEIAESLEANDLKKYCEEIVIRNLDYILTVSIHAIASASLDILANLEKFLDLRSSEPWSYRRLPTATATIPAIINSEEDSESEFLKTRTNHARNPASKKDNVQIVDDFLKPYDDVSHGVCKQIRALKKKLQQIEMLEEKQMKGHLLDEQQITKLQMRPLLESSLAELGVPIVTMSTEVPSLILPDERVGKGVEVSRKQRKSKQKARQCELVSSNGEILIEPNLVKGFLDTEVSQAKHKKNDAVVEGTEVKQLRTKSCTNKDFEDISKNKSSSSVSSKKKNRKGGLSLFLSGALDNIPKDVPAPPPSPKNEGPAWGGARLGKLSASLREIQDEQSKIKENKFSRSKDQVEQLSEGKNDGKLPLGLFLPSNPIPMVSAQTSPTSDGERDTPPWIASGTPPFLSRPSLRDIQLQQGKRQQVVSHSPKTRTTGFSIVSGLGLPSESSGPNRWFKPEVESASSIRSIQIEEKAIKDLKRFYSCVKIVKNPS